MDGPFEEIVRRHHVRVLQLCRSLLGDRDRAEDAAQEVFLKAYRSLSGFQGQSAVGTWLYRIATNHCLDMRRKEARRKEDSLDQIIDGEGERVDRLLHPTTPAADPAEASDLTARLLSALPEEQRFALILRETQGLSYAEIAAALSCSEDSIRARLRRARESLREALQRFL